MQGTELCVILIWHVRQLLFAVSHSSTAKQSLNLVTRDNFSGHTGKIRGSEKTRMQTDLVHLRTRMTVQPYKATQIIPLRTKLVSARTPAAA